MLKIGEKFGRLTVVAEHGLNKHKKRMYLCKCDCGNGIIAIGSHLKNGNTKSCGCYKKEKAGEINKTHGLRGHSLYGVWATMKGRCENPTNPKYDSYGKRGITVCADWHSFERFYAWAIENGYKKELTLDRIDVNGNYEPSNCRWATAKQQSNNKRDTIYISAFGETKTISEWAEITGLKHATIYNRIRRNGMSGELALAPIGAYKNRKVV